MAITRSVNEHEGGDLWRRGEGGDEKGEGGDEKGEGGMRKGRGGSKLLSDIGSYS